MTDKKLCQNFDECCLYNEASNIESWVSVDLEDRFEINAVRMMIGEHMGSFELRIGDSPGQGELCFAHQNVLNAYERPEVMLCDTPVEGRYLTIKKLGFESMSICEIEAWGVPIAKYWTTWNSWSECSRTCGFGIRMRERNCIDRGDGYGNCRGLDFENQPCSDGPCENEKNLALGTRARDYSDKDAKNLVDGKSRTCFVSEYTFEPYIEIELNQLTEVHTIRINGDNLPPLDIKIDEQNCILLNEGITEFSCNTFPTGRVLRITAFDIEDELKLCEVEVYGSYGLQWGEWGEWSKCEADCHFGIRERTRECNGDFGVCPGEWHQTSWCNKGPCEKHKNLISPKTQVEMDNAFDFSPATLSTDGDISCAKASAERNTCCTLGRLTTEPTFSINLDKYIEVNTVKIYLPSKYSFERLQVRVGVTKNIQKSTICRDLELSVENDSGWITFKCVNKVAAQWVIITVPEKTTNMGICEVEVYGAPIRNWII